MESLQRQAARNKNKSPEMKLPPAAKQAGFLLSLLFLFLFCLLHQQTSFTVGTCTIGTVRMGKKAFSSPVFKFTKYGTGFIERFAKTTVHFLNQFPFCLFLFQKSSIPLIRLSFFHSSLAQP